MEISEKEYADLKQHIGRLQRENFLLKNGIRNFRVQGKTVSVPDDYEFIFSKVEEVVGEYFTGLNINPTKGSIDINGERYVLVRASALSFDFFHKIMDLYSDRGIQEAIVIGKNFLFDIAHVIGIEDAKNFHKVMKLKDPLEKLSAGPAHFAYTGWAFVNILPDSRPSPDEDFFLRYEHPNSFESDSWLRSGKKSDFPVCVMNSGYSSGWCEQSFDFPLTAVEITCRAKGDRQCTFIMAPPHRISEYLEKEEKSMSQHVFDIPVFFERKKAEEKIKASLEEKDILLKEIHHRVKNNLQIISSLLKLQSGFVNDKRMEEIMRDSQNRIKTMAIVHEKLYQANFESVDLGEYLRSIIRLAFDSYRQPGPDIEIIYDLPSIPVNIKIDVAIPCGLMVNEVFTNAFKYAFTQRKKGTIAIKMQASSKEIVLIIEDNGIGIPDEIDMENSATFGLELIRLLVVQLDASMKVSKANGTAFTFRIPLREENKKL